MNLVLLFV